jgi:O-antigen/teichoic acid export membrane protein
MKKALARVNSIFVNSRRKLQGRASWLGGGLWAVADQSFLVTSNFIISVLLARWLSPQDYGAFTVAYAILWVVTNLHTSLLTGPLAVFGPGKYRARLSEYLGVLLYGHLGFSAIAGVLLMLLSIALELTGSKALPSALLSLVLAGPLILFSRGLMRQVCYVHLKPGVAAFGGASYMATILPGAYFLYKSDLLSAGAGLLLMGFASLVTGLLLAVPLRMSLTRLRGNGLYRVVLKDHWDWGRWTIPGNGLGFIASQGYLLLLPIWGGLEASATFRALTNLTTPIVHIASAFSLFLLPILVQARGRSEFGRHMRFALTLFIVGSGVYWLLLGFFHRPLVTWLYGGNYERYSDLLWLMGLIPLLTGLVSLLAAAFEAVERPDQIFWAQVFASVVTLTVGLGLLVIWGVVGAAAGSIVSQMAIVGALMWLWRKKGSDEKHHRHA